MVRDARVVGFLVLLMCATGCQQGASNSADNSSPAPVDPNYEGFLENAHDTQIIGWAWHKNRPDEPVEVDLLDGDKGLTTVKADSFRQDLLDGKIGNGKHYFEVATPESLKDGKPHEIHAVVSGTKFELKESPKKYQFQAKDTPGK